MSAFTQDKRYRELGIAYLEEVEKKGGEVTMCRVADALVNQGISQGIQQGMELGRKEGFWMDVSRCLRILDIRQRIL